MSKSWKPRAWILEEAFWRREGGRLENGGTATRHGEPWKRKEDQETDEHLPLNNAARTTADQERGKCHDRICGHANLRHARLEPNSLARRSVDLYDLGALRQSTRSRQSSTEHYNHYIVYSIARVAG